MYKYIEEGLTLIKSLSTLNKLLKIILPLIHADFDIENFQVYLLGLILQERRFSTFGISKRNETKSMWQIYYALNKSINWQKIYYTLANYCFVMFMGFNWYLVVDGSPLRQKYARYRITKRGFVCVKGIKNMPHDELISLSLTNGIVYIPLDFRIWTSKKITNKRDYKKKTEIFSAMLYEYLIKRIPVKTILFDNGFASMKILKWLNKNGFTWFTRIKSNKKVKCNGNNCKLKDLNLEIGKSIVLEMVGVSGNVKIIRICHQDEVVYIATNQTNIEDTQLIITYKKRWKVEEFHREAKQHLGLENIRMRNWQKLQNHVGFVCLSYALLSILRQEWKGSIGNVKHIIFDEIYQIHDAYERLLQKLAC
jgi:SRSO17 transposase